MNEINFDDHVCRLCSRKCVGKRSIANHLAQTHKMSLREYVLKFYFDDAIPKCKCGCEKEVKWNKISCRFNVYVNGHNEAGFKKKNYRPTEEQIKKRNDAIRKTYEERGNEIKEKISKQVKKGLKESGINFSEYFKEKWNDEDFRSKQHKARIKSWQGEEGEIRRKKVFTEKFSRKISEANMKRDTKRTSKAEQDFINQLREKLPNEIIVESMWINKDEVNKCYDAYLPKRKCLIEFDGIYWHGLDRDEGFTFDQLHNIENDKFKNNLAEKVDLNLLRFKEGVDIDDVKSFEDLIKKAYFTKFKKRIIKKDMMTQ